MRWDKLFLTSFVIGLYFFSITPMHFYAHSIEGHQDENSQILDDCSYINLLSTGQGSYLGTDVLYVEEEVIEPNYRFQIVLNQIIFYSLDLESTQYLRGPPQNS